MQKNPRDYFTTTQIARLCGMSQATILRAITMGRLKASTTPGGHFRVSRLNMLEFMRENNVTPPLELENKARILIVEDNPQELQIFKKTLEQDDLEIKTTASGVEAGYLIRDFRPHILLLDIFLKDIDGREVVRIIRSDPELQHTAIIAITGSRDPKELDEIRESGIDRLILKPITPVELRKEILGHLKKSI